MFSSFARCRPLVALAAMATIFTFALPGCGSSAAGGDGTNHEIVYVHVFNGYPGSQSLSLYGPSGRVVSNLPFGERTPEPVAINRNYGSDFILVLDGAPQTFPLMQDLYALYPQETATFFVGQRQDTSATIRVFRHIQSISPGCRLVLNNSLALQSEGLGQFSFIPGFDFAGIIPLAGYDEAAEQAILDPEDQRPDLYNRINEFPYFAFVEVQDDDDEPTGTGERTTVWIGEEDRTDMNIDYASGTIISHPPSAEYIQCVLEQEEADEDDEDFEEVDCGARQMYSGDTYSPGDDTVTQFVHYYPERFGHSANSGTCDTSFRIFSDFDNIFEGSHGHDGYNNNVRIDHHPSFGISDHYFFVLYGRPVEPKIEAWIASDRSTGGGFEDMDPYPGE